MVRSLHPYLRIKYFMLIEQRVMSLTVASSTCQVGLIHFRYRSTRIWYYYIIFVSMKLEIFIFNAISVSLDQTPSSAVSDHGLQCFACHF